VIREDLDRVVGAFASAGLAASTYQLLGRTMTAAVNADMIARSPCRAVRLPKVECEEMRFLTPPEVARLAGVINPRYRALVLVGAYGGLRIGELAGLRRGRVDLLRGTIDVAEIVVEVRDQLYTGPPRTRAGRRTVGLPRAVVEELAAHMGPVGPADGYVFTAERVACCGPQTSERRYGCPLSAPQAWTLSAPTTFATRRSPSGSPPAPTPRRWLCGPVTHQCHSHSTATGTYSRATTPSSRAIAGKPLRPPPSASGKHAR
jgi:hypothetical protein